MNLHTLPRALTVALTALSLVACQNTMARPDAGTKAQPSALAENAQTVDRSDLINATLWFQSAAEYDMVTRQSFKLALHQVQLALLDPDWTAAIEQTKPGYDLLPPAVVVDVDETMLDNSPYQARLIRNGEQFTAETWDAWVKERKAKEIPGAAAYTQALKRLGVTVIYLSNREATHVEDTRVNLQALGFAYTDDSKYFTFSDRDKGLSSKGKRREIVAQSYRIVQLVGDNLGDFDESYKQDVAKRDAIVSKAAQNGWLGTRWIALPNPMYGSWEETSYGYSRDASFEKKLEAKKGLLDGQ